MTTDDNNREQRRGVLGIFKSSSGITLCTLVSTAVGFATQVLLAAAFGTSEQMDAYLVSLTLPTMVVAVFAGSLNYTFIPVFVEKISNGDEPAAWRIVNDMFNISLWVLLFLTLAAGATAGGVVRVTAPGLASAVKGEAAGLFRIQTPVIVFSGLTALLSSAYYAHKRFLYPSLATLVNSATILAAVSLFSRSAGISAAAWGGLVGSALSFLILVPILRKVPRYRFSLLPKEDGSRKIIRLIIPLLCGAIFYRGDDLIQRFIASTFPAGSISCLAYAFKLVSTCSSLVVSGISIVLLQHVSELASQQEKEAIRSTFRNTFRWLTFFMMLVISCSVVSGENVIALLFQRGRFGPASTHFTWLCLVLYSGVMYAGVIGAVTTPVFYAFRDTKLVVKIGIAGALLQLALSFLLARVFSEPGLPLAYSLSALTTITVFLSILDRKYVSLPLPEMAGSLLRSVLAGVLAALLIWHLDPLLLPPLSPLSSIAIKVPLTALVYLALAAALKLEEAQRLTKGASALWQRRKPVGSLEK